MQRKEYRDPQILKMNNTGKILFIVILFCGCTESMTELPTIDVPEKASTKAAQIIPNRHYPLYLLAKLYKDAGQTQKAKETAAILLEKPVKIPSLLIETIKQEAEKILNYEPD